MAEFKKLTELISKKELIRVDGLVAENIRLKRKSVDVSEKCLICGDCKDVYEVRYAMIGEILIAQTENLLQCYCRFCKSKMFFRSSIREFLEIAKDLAQKRDDNLLLDLVLRDQNKFSLGELKNPMLDQTAFEYKYSTSLDVYFGTFINNESGEVNN